MTNDGLLIVDKPAGWTSNDVVQKVKRLLGARKVGHTGTLDPAATGVLVLCVNGATKWATEMRDHDKSYQACVSVGRSTDTGDATGKVLQACPVDPLQEEVVREVLSAFRGTIRQQVPRYAAVKVQGKALYRWARQNREVVRPYRDVTIHELSLESLGADTMLLQVRCSTGTYIRALAEDIGERLGYPAHLASLRRTQVGPFQLSQAMTLDSIQQQVAAEQFNPENSLLGREWALSS